MNNETMRRKFENDCGIPDGVIYNKEKDAYCWNSHPSVICPDFNASYESYCLGHESAHEHQQKEIDRLRAALTSVKDLIKETYGVVGLHQNGSISPWSDLRKGGYYEEWLIEFDQALEQTPSNKDKDNE